MGKFKDLTGQHFGRLTALESLPSHGKNSARLWLCECECESSHRARYRPHERTYIVVRLLSKNAESDTDIGTASSSDLVEHETTVFKSEKARLQILRGEGDNGM